MKLSRALLLSGAIIFGAESCHNKPESTRIEASAKCTEETRAKVKKVGEFSPSLRAEQRHQRNGVGSYYSFN